MSNASRAPQGAAAARLVVRNTAVQVAGEVVSKLASLAFYIVMARALGERGFGDFTFAASVVLFIEIAALGTDLILTRDVAREHHAVHRLFWNVNAIKGTLGLGAVAIVAVITVAGDYSHDVRAAVALLAAARLVEIFAKTVHATFRALEETVPVALALVLQRILTAAIGIPAMLLGGGLVLVSAIYLAGALIALAYIGARLAAKPAVRPRFEVSAEMARNIARRGWPIGITWIIGAVLARLDAVLLSLLKDNVAVGLYGAAYRLYEATFFLSWTFSLSALPALSRLGRATSPTIGEAYAVGCKAMLLVLAPIGASFVLFARPLMELIYGQSFERAAPALQMLGAATIFYGILMLSVQVLTAQDRRRVLVPIGLLVLIENAVLNLVLIPGYSFNGAAVAVVASIVTYAVAVMAYAVRVTGKISWLRVSLGSLGGCATMTAIALALGRDLPAIAVSGLGYVLVAFALEKCVFPRDVELLGHTLRFRRLTRRA